MEQKFKEYRQYDWTLSKQWQNYLDNIFPTPTRDRLEKIRRKWYKEHVDKDFDVNFEPSASTDSGNARPQGSAYQNF